MKMKFRDSRDKAEIKQIIKKSENRTNIIWQNALGKRLIYKIRKIEMHEVVQILKLQIDEYNSMLDQQEVVYINLGFRNTIFKANILSIEKDVLSLFVPLEVKTQELREHSRKKFQMSDEKYLSLYFDSPLTRSSSQVLKFKLLDISDGGAGLIISDKNKHFFETSHIFTIGQIGEHKLGEFLLAQKCYFSRIRYRKAGKVQNANRIGLQFMDLTPTNQAIISLI